MTLQLRVKVIRQRLSGVQLCLCPCARFRQSQRLKRALGQASDSPGLRNRAGLLTGNGKTVVRGGYRLLYDPPFYNIYLNMATSAPEVFLQTFSGTTATPASAFPLPGIPTGPNIRAELAPAITPGVLDPRTQAETTVSPNFGPDKVHTWSLGIERELSKNSAVEARYVGNRAANLFQTIDGNPFIADLATIPQFLPAGLTPCTTPQFPLHPESLPDLPALILEERTVDRVWCVSVPTLVTHITMHCKPSFVPTTSLSNSRFGPLTRSARLWTTLARYSALLGAGQCGILAKSGRFQRG